MWNILLWIGLGIMGILLVLGFISDDFEYKLIHYLKHRTLKNYPKNKVVWTKSNDEEFIERTNRAYDRCEDNNEYYSVDEFLEEIKKW